MLGSPALGTGNPAQTGATSENNVTRPAAPDIGAWQSKTAIATVPGGTVVLGSGGTLTDSATLTGGYNPTGSITFVLYSPSNTAVYAETVPVSGNGTYTTPTGYTPTVAGTYCWEVSYSGDANNSGATPASLLRLHHDLPGSCRLPLRGVGRHRHCYRGRVNKCGS